MPLQHSVAALATEIVYKTPRNISVAADFFHAYPRIFGASKIFSADLSYRIGLYKLTIPYGAAGIAVLFLALTANFFFFFKRGVVPGADDTQESDPNVRDNTGRAFLVFSCFLNLAIIICIGIASGSSYTLRQAAFNAHDALAMAQWHIQYHLQASALTLQKYADELAAMKRDGTISESAPVKTVYQLFGGDVRQPIDSLVSTTTDLLYNLNLIDDQFKYLSTRFFLFTAAVLFSCLVGLLITFICDFATPDKKRLRITGFGILLVPMVATWAHTALSTSIAVASGDFCQSVSEYHRFIHSTSQGQSTSSVPSNIFLQYGLECPGEAILNEIRELQVFVGSTNGSEDFNKGIKATLGEEVAQKWPSAMEWIDKRLSEYNDDRCQMLLELAGQISFNICGDYGLSGVSTVGQLWLASCGLTLLFMVVVALLTFGHPPSEFCSGRELLYIYGAPKLISAFGDVPGVLKKQDTFYKRQNNLSTVDSFTSSEDPSEERRAEYDEDLSHFPMSSDRRRRDAFISSTERGRRQRDSSWYLGSNNSSDSSGLGFS